MVRPESSARYPLVHGKSFPSGGSRVQCLRGLLRLRGHLRLRGLFASVLLLISVTTHRVTATDYFLTIAGGYAPHGNQASMEANVLFFQELLARAPAAEERKHFIFFADGNQPLADVQTAENQPPLLEIDQILAEVCQWGTEQLEYRDHRIANVMGRNNVVDIEQGLRSIVESLKVGDRFFLYVTAHGGAAKGGNAFDTKIHGWDESMLHAHELANWLEGIPREVPVFLVMAQCYCGGFAHTIFNAADQADGLAEGLRCGFFAQQHNLPAAGCRPDIADDQEYSSFFWGALAGKTRGGTVVEGADYDGDGKICFAEAHIYAVLMSQTIDIPLRCSESLLRTYSRTGESGKALSAHETEASAEHEGTCALTLDHPLQELIDQASFVNHQIARGLIDQLELDPQQSARSIREHIEAANRRHYSERRQRRRDERAYREAAAKLKARVLERWPALEPVKHLVECADHGLALTSIHEEVMEWAEYKQMLARWHERQSKQQQKLAAELENVKRKRLAHTLESIILEANLENSAPPEILQRYEEILALELSTLD